MPKPDKPDKLDRKQELEKLWWKISDLKNSGLFDEIEDLGDNDGRLEYHFDDELLYIISEDGVVAESHNGHNFTHTCPPDCE